MKDQIAKKEPFQVTCDLEVEYIYLMEDIDALRFVYDNMSEEGYQREETFDEKSAIFFGHRVSIYLSMLNLIQRDVTRTLEEMDNSVQSLYQLIRDTSQGETSHE